VQNPKTPKPQNPKTPYFSDNLEFSIILQIIELLIKIDCFVCPFEI
jgi:hypothetical protein